MHRGGGKDAQWVIFYTLFRENVTFEFRWRAKRKRCVIIDQL